MKKLFMILGLVFLFGLTGAGYWLYTNAGGMVKARAERVASESLGVKVSIGSLNIDLRNKAVTLGNIEIENPDGFDKDLIMAIGEVNIRIDTMSEQFLGFNQIAVNDSMINLEVAAGGTNMTALHKMAVANQGDTAGDSGINVAIKRLTINNARLSVTSEFLENPPETLIMPDMSMTNIGTAQNGIPAAAAMAEITRNLSTTVMRTALQSGYLQGMSQSFLDNMQLRYESTDAVVDKVKSDFKKAGEELQGLMGGWLGDGNSATEEMPAPE